MTKFKVYGARRRGLVASDSYDTSNMRDCPECGGKAVGRECVPGGWINCAKGHRYPPDASDDPSRDTTPTQGLRFSQAIREARASEIQRLTAVQAIENMLLYSSSAMPCTCEDVSEGSLVAILPRMQPVAGEFRFVGEVSRSGAVSYYRVTDCRLRCVMQDSVAGLTGLPAILAVGQTLDITLRISI